MVGAGSATVAWCPETSYLGGVSGTPTYRDFGANVQVQSAELTRNLLEIVAPDDPETQAFLAQNMEGQLGISFILKNDEFHRLVFNDSFTGFTSGAAQSAEVYLGVDTFNSTTERQIKGWAPATCDISYNGAAEAVRVTLSGPYGDETQNTSITPGTIDRAGDEVPGHGASLSVNSTSVTMAQSATLSFSQLSRLIRGPSAKPIDVVNGDVQQSIEMASVYDGADRYKLALGGPTANSVETQVDEVPANLSFDVGGTTIADYSLAGVAPDTYEWEDLAAADANLNESINFSARGVTASDPTV